MIKKLKEKLEEEIRLSTLTKAEIASKIGVYPQDMARIINQEKYTRVETILKAFEVLGKEVKFEIINKEETE